MPPQGVRAAYYDDGLPEDASFLLAVAGWGWRAEVAVHILRLALSGTLDRHPRLKLMIGHMGEGLPAMMERGDVSTVRLTRAGLPRTWLGVFRRRSPRIHTLLDTVQRRAPSGCVNGTGHRVSGYLRKRPLRPSNMWGRAIGSYVLASPVDAPLRSCFVGTLL
jgi:Amidohydrolase